MGTIVVFKQELGIYPWTILPLALIEKKPLPWRCYWPVIAFAKNTFCSLYVLDVTLDTYLLRAADISFRRHATWSRR